jgi:site-specific recombinase XerD
MAKRIRWTEMDKSKTPFATLRAAFKVYNQTTGKSPHTVKWYEFRLELFERWLGEVAALEDVTVQNVRAYIAELQGRTERWSNNPFIKNKSGQLSTSYINGFARAFRAFSTWLQEDGYTEENLLKHLKPPKIQQKVTETLTDEDVSRLLSPLDQDDAFGARDFAIIWTMLDCGLLHLAEFAEQSEFSGNSEHLTSILMPEAVLGLAMDSR